MVLKQRLLESPSIGGFIASTGSVPEKDTTTDH